MPVAADLPSLALLPIALRSGFPVAGRRRLTLIVIHQQACVRGPQTMFLCNICGREILEHLLQYEIFVIRIDVFLRMKTEVGLTHSSFMSGRASPAVRRVK